MTTRLVMIVRDEAAVLGWTLEAALPRIDGWTIVDTGSTDGTQAIVRAILGHLPGELVERPWLNFGHNRSEALALARGQADWLLIRDADMTVSIDDGWSPDPAVDAYMIEMGNGEAFRWRLPLLVRGDLPWRSVGAVHEYTALPDRAYEGVPTDAVRIRYPDRSSAAKTSMHRDLLETAMGDDPDDPRTVFYLAQTQRELGELSAARELYVRRASMGGFEEEAWYAAYRAALLAPWPHQADELLAAWERRPERLEPLHDLVAELNRRDRHAAAFRLALPAGDPPPDVLFLHGDVWDWGMAFERSIAAWWVGDRDEFARLTIELLANPRLPANVRLVVLRNASVAIAA